VTDEENAFTVEPSTEDLEMRNEDELIITAKTARIMVETGRLCHFAAPDNLGVPVLAGLIALCSLFQIRTLQGDVLEEGEFASIPFDDDRQRDRMIKALLSDVASAWQFATKLTMDIAVPGDDEEDPTE
jgi:hypothetical protein